MIKCTETKLPGVIIIEPAVFSDDRGYFLETFQEERYQQLGIATHFVQDNFSRSQQDVVRGLHYQLEKPQGKLVSVSAGKVLDIVVDVRASSKTFGQFIAVELDDVSHRQIYIPPGYAHGFCVLSPYADFIYKCTDYYHAPSERGILWNDPILNLPWPLKNPILSTKDKALPLLSNIAEHELPRCAV